MADKLAIMAELARRGKLPPDKAALFAEAQKRGLVPGGAQPPSAPQQAVPPPGLVPGSREYADWAAQAARAGQQLPQVSGPAPTGEPPAEAPNLLNSTLATVNGLTAAVPFLQEGTDALMGLGGMAMGKDYGQTVKGLQDRRAQLGKSAPLARMSGELAGLVAAPEMIGTTKLGSEALGMSGPLLKQFTNSALSTAGYEGLKGLSQGHTGAQLLGDEGLGFAGGVAGTAGGKALEKAGGSVASALTSAAQNKLTKSAIVGAPDAEGLKNVSRALFKKVDDSGVTVDTPKFTQFVAGLATAAKKDHIDETLDPKAFGVYRQLVSILGEAQSGARPLTISDLHTIRQIAQKAAVSTEGRDSMFANRIVDGLDGFISQPGVMSSGGKEAGNNLLSAISTWGRARRVSLIEEAVYKAQNQASGVENGLRTQFRSLLQDPNKRKLFTDVELSEIKKVANGTHGSNLTRLLGMFGFDFGSGRNMVGGSIGALVGGLPLVVAGSLARKGAEKLAVRGANKVAKVVATPGIPVAPQARNLLAPSSMPLNLLIRGGSVTASGN